MENKEIEKLYNKKFKLNKEIDEEIRLLSLKSSAEKAETKKQRIAAYQQWEDDGRPPPIIIEPEPEVVVIEEPPSDLETKPPPEVPKIEDITDLEIQITEDTNLEVLEEVIEKKTVMVTIGDIPQDFIDEYEDETGKKAIWKGAITNGFKEFLNGK